jgi:glycosyltransferase involved in cell wall biosynthesis
VKLEIWSPLPPVPSGIADHVAEALPHLTRRAEVAMVTPSPWEVERDALRGARLLSPDESDRGALRLYVLGNSHWHTFVYREALRRPGVLWMHEWSLHGLVLAATFLEGDAATYRRLMRDAYGATGTTIAGQVMGGFCGPLVESLFPLSEHVVTRSRAVLATTAFTAERAARVLSGPPVRHLPLHALLPLAPLPSRREARRKLGLPESAPLVVAPGLANPLKRLDVAVRVAGRLRATRPDLRLVVAGDNRAALPLAAQARTSGLGDGLLVTGRLGLLELALHLVAADVVLALRFPSLGEMSAVLLRALAAGRAAVVTAGTPAADELPPGTVVPVDPGRHEEVELEAVIATLLDDPALARRVGEAARDHVVEHHDPDHLAGLLLEFLTEARDTPVPPPIEETPGLPGALLGELERVARELRLETVPEEIRRRALGLGARRSGR